MSLATEEAVDAAKIMYEVGVPVTLGSQTVTCILNKVRRALDMEDAGYLSDNDCEIVTILANWTTAPAVNDKVTIASVSYRVLARDDATTGVLSTIQLGRVN